MYDPYQTRPGLERRRGEGEGGEGGSRSLSEVERTWSDAISDASN